MTTPIGVYRGAAADIVPVQAYEAFLGRTVDYVLAFTADSPVSWAQFEQAIMPDGTNGPPGATPATAWAPLLGPRQLVLSVPACCLGTTWTGEGNGTGDSHWQALAATLVSGGLGSCVLRVAREFNGPWTRWQVTPGNAAAYQDGYAHVVQVMRAAGFAGKFMWNPYLGQGTMGPSLGAENCYPGDSAVDVIGVDLYDGPSVSYPPGEMVRTPGQQQAVWATFRDQWDGLAGWVRYAKDLKRKPLAFPEWGLRLWNDAGKYGGGGDNPVLVTEMAALMQNSGQNGRTFMHALWEDPGMGVSDPRDHPARLVQVPQARAAFLAAFGAEP